MKKTIFIILFLVLAVSIMAYGVKAFTISDLELGSTNQDRDQTINGNLVITNNESSQVTVSLASSVGSNYQLTFSRTSVPIAANQPITIPVSIYVPNTQIVGRQNIGLITATDSLGRTATSNVFLTAKNELLLYKIRTTIADKATTLSDGDSVKAKPGDDVTLEVTARNDNTDNVDIRDITVDVSSDSDLDWSDSSDISDLSNGDKDTASFSFNVPNDLDTGDYDVDVTLQGRDENGVRYEQKATITIRVERTSHEIKIDSLTLTPSEVSCGGRVTLRATLDNTGSHDETATAVTVKNNDLRLDQYSSHLTIDQGNTLDKTYTFLVPNSTQPGEYIVDVAAYYDGNTQTDDQVTSLTVDPCTTTTTTTVPPVVTNPVTPTPTPAPVVIPVGNAVGPSYGSTSFWNSPVYMVVLIAAAVIILVLIIILLVKFVF